jgi:DNA-binding NarL/FixJ family response regulator
MNVMIVDDSEKMRSMIKSVLLKSVDHFVECSDGSEVVAAYGRHHPDWILMDVVMREMDGITATEEVTRSFPEAKIIIVTQYDDADLREKAKDAGAIGFVLKENLIDIERIIRGRKN